MEWTEWMRMILRQMWLEGDACAAIGRKLGTSPSAIAGKARREGLPKRKPPIEDGPEIRQKRMEGQRAATERRRAAKGLPPLPPPSPKPVEAVRFTPMEIPLPPPSTCSWPLGELGSKGFRMCGAKPVRGKPYCADHCKIAYVKIRDRREDAA